MLRGCEDRKDEKTEAASWLGGVCSSLELEPLSECSFVKYPFLKLSITNALGSRDHLSPVAKRMINDFQWSSELVLSTGHAVCLTQAPWIFSCMNILNVRINAVTLGHLNCLLALNSCVGMKGWQSPKHVLCPSRWSPC